MVVVTVSTEETDFGVRWRGKSMIVTRNSFLDLDSHWQSLLRSLFRHNTCGKPLECELQEFCVISLCYENVNNGNVVGDLGARNRLVVMNYHDTHFNPCLPR